VRPQRGRGAIQGDGALAQAAQGGCGVSSGDIQDPPGQGPVQPALGDPPSAGGLDWVTPRGPFQPQTFCDSVSCALCRAVEATFSGTHVEDPANVALCFGLFGLS